MWPAIIFGLLCSISVFGHTTSQEVDIGMDDCSIEKLSNPYVIASFQYFPVYTGCSSRGRTLDGQEVHLVSLKHAKNYGEPETEIQIFLKNVDRLNDPAAPVLVFASAVPVIWRIHSEQTDNFSAMGHIWTSNNSRVVKDKHLKFKVKAVDLPTDRNKLVSWVRRRFNTVTSVMELPMANLINVEVGNDADELSETCVIRSNISNSMASVIDIQETTGCIARWNEGVEDMDVHIFELKAASVQYPLSGRQEIILNIRPKSRLTSRKNLRLVLKSHQLVTWKIITRGLKDSTLDVMTDQAVDSNNINTQSFRAAAESLSTYTGHGLIEWTTEKYGPPVSYTAASLANQLDLIFDAGGLFHHVSEGLPIHRPAVHPSAAALLDDRSQHKIVRGRIGDAKMSIVRAMSISCWKEGISATVEKRALEGYTTSRHDVTLLNSSCHAADNRTHFILTSLHNNCGTRRLKSDDGSVILVNAVNVRYQIVDHSDPISASAGSEHVALEHDIAPLAELDSLLSINISCDYADETSLNRDANATDGSSVTSPDIQFRLKLYRDRSFLDEISAFPAQVLNRDRLYVEATLTAADHLKVVISNCSLETADNRLFRHSLISEGCITDRTGAWLSEDDQTSSPHSEIFGFTFQKYLDYDFALNLKCDLTVCSLIQNLSQSNIPVCKPKDELCTVHHQAVPKLYPTIDAPMIRGPIVIAWKEEEPTQKKDTSVPSGRKVDVYFSPDNLAKSDVVQAEDESCQPTIIVDGLSTEIVVVISFVAFMIGIMLMSSLWFIYMRTATMKKSKKRLRSPDSSGDSTPSSTAPMTNRQIICSR